MSQYSGDHAGQIVAAVDVGSNTIKMTVGQWDGHSLSELLGDARTVRLSGGIEQSGSISHEREAAALACLTDFANAARHAGATEFIGVATEVVRVAANGAAFLNQVKARTPWRLDVISGDEEAALTFAGVKPEVGGVATALIADIGGGSTELIAVVGGETSAFVSLPIGSGRLTDRFVTNDPPAINELQRCRDAVSDCLGGAEFAAPAPLQRLLVTGGTGIYLGALVGGEQRFPPDRIALAAQTLGSFPSAIVSDVLRIPIERARLLPAGVAVVDSMIALWSPREVAVTESGIRRGLLLRYFGGMGEK